MLNWICKREKDIRRILMWLFVLMMGMQIIPGIAWLAVNFTDLPLFHETFLLEQAADTLVVDEYIGILYPLLLKAIMWISGVVQISYHIPVYILQLLAAGFAAVYMLRCSGWISGSRGLRMIKYAYGTAYLVTFPLLLQMHLAVLPYSLATSVAIILICDGLHYLYNVNQVRGTVLIRLCGLWMLNFLLVPEYSWILGVFVVAVLVRVMLGNKQWRTRILLCILSTVLCFGVIGQTTQTPGSMGRMQKTVSSSLLSRFIWPYFVSYSYFWPEEIQDTFEGSELFYSTKYTEAMFYEFGSIMEEKYGRDAADDIYLDMAITALGLDTRRILTDAGRDFGAYLCPQAAFQLQRNDNYGSLLSWNYGRLQDQAPLLTKYYVNMSFAGWNVMCILGVLLILVCKRGRILSCGSVILGISILFMAFWYTMQGAGIQDYKKALLLSFLWLLPVIRGFLLTEENE